MTLAEDKAAARARALERRKAAHAAAPVRPADALAALLAKYRGTPLSGYMPIRTEIDPLPAMAEATAHGPVGVPVIIARGRPLAFHLWQPGTDMTEGPFGARVPAHGRPMVPEIVIVPLLAFTRSGHRLGYGGGFYDRTLARLRARGPVVAIGFAYAAQEVDSLPLEATDERLDLIVTETGILSPRP